MLTTHVETQFASVMDELEKHGSRLEKEAILKNLDELGQRLLKWALDPAITFGVTVPEDRLARLPQHECWDQDVFWDKMETLCEKLSKRELTGNAAAAEVIHVLTHAPCDNDIKWAARLLNKNLRCGVHLSTMKKIFQGLVEPFAVALAKPYEPLKHSIQGKWCIEPKLDGLRMTVVDGVAYTRNGRTIDTVGHILTELAPFMDKYVFDGEVMSVGDFDTASGAIRRKSVVDNKAIYYNVFDVIDRDEWETRKTAPLSERKLLMKKVFETKFKHVRAVEFLELPENPTSQQLFDLRDVMIKHGYEGAMLKNMGAPYVFKRSDHLLKLKDFVDADCVCTGEVEEGKGKHKGSLGAIWVEFEGVKSKVGSGFTDAQRDQLWAIRDKLRGKMVEVQYQNKTADGSLRFPVFIKFRPDKE